MIETGLWVSSAEYAEIDSPDLEGGKGRLSFDCKEPTSPISLVPDPSDFVRCDLGNRMTMPFKRFPQ